MTSDKIMRHELVPLYIEQYCMGLSQVASPNYSFSNKTPFISFTYLGSFLYCNLQFLVDDLDNLFLRVKEMDCHKSDVFSVFRFRNLCHRRSKKTSLPRLHLEARSLKRSKSLDFVDYRMARGKQIKRATEGEMPPWNQCTNMVVKRLAQKL